MQCRFRILETCCCTLEYKMGINSKDIQMYLWIFLEFSMRLCCNFVRENPLLSFVSLMFIMLYVFFSSAFWFLFYSLPLLLIAGLIVIVIYHPECPTDIGTENRENVDPKSSVKIRLAEDEGKKKKSVGRARSVRRRKSKKDFPPYVEEDGGGSIFIPTGFGDHHVFDKSPLTEEHMKDIREVEVLSTSDHTECSSLGAAQSLESICVDVFSNDPQKPFRGRDDSQTEMADDSENEGDSRQDRSMGVQWTRDDKKNMMDLSEMERNKRLESLMARRRARRLVSIHVRRTLMNLGSDDPPISIVIPRTNSGSNALFSPVPGSAPSVLLPNHNPFDLPYDQHEEKPNLRGGSFQQDFMVPHQDLMFCRHESFSLGASFYGDFNSDLHLHKVLEASENYRSITPFGGKDDADRLTEQDSVEEPEQLNHVNTSDVKEPQCEEESGEVQIKSVLIEDIEDRTSSSSSSSEEDEPFYRIDKDAILKSLTTPPAPRNITADNQDNGQVYNYFAKFAMFPTPSHSIASDLQVEVSEFGSPPRSVDGTSSLEEDISVYNKEMEKDTSGNESELRSREVPGVTEQDLVEVGFSNINPSLIISPESVIQQDSVVSQSFVPTNAHNSEENLAASTEEDDILELIKRNSHEKQGAELAISGDSDLETSFPQEPVIEQADVSSFPSLPSPITVSDLMFLTDQEGSSNVDHQVQVMVPEVNWHGVENSMSVQQVSDVSSSTTSPKSQPKTSINQDLSSNFVSELYTDHPLHGFAERRFEDSGFSMVDQNCNDPESVLAQVSSASSSSSSPKSVSQTKLSMNPSSCSLDQDTEMEEVPQLQNQIAETSTHQATEDISSPATFHDWGQLLSDQTNHQPLDRTSNMQDEASTGNLDHKSSEEGSDNDHIDPSVVEDGTQNKDSIIERDGLPEHETSVHHSESLDHKKYSEKIHQ